jgi:DNA-binding SARP family transcriptional activator
MRVGVAEHVAAGGIGERVTPRLGMQERLVLAYLLLHAGAVPREALADAVWGERRPASWQGSLRVLVSKGRAVLRRLVPDAELTSAAGCYTLALPDGVEVDERRAIRLLEEARRAGDPVAAEVVAALDEVLAITARPLLPAVDVRWLDDVRRELREMRCSALVLRSEAYAAAGDAAAAVRSAAEAVSLDRLGEAACRALMRAHLLRGEPVAALRAYAELQAQLAEDLGVDPSPATQQLHLEVLRAGDAEVGRRAGRRRELLAQARARAAAGQQVGAERLYLEVAASARADGDARHLAEAALGFSGARGAYGRTDPADVALLEEAHGAVERVDDALAVTVRSRLAVATVWDDAGRADAEGEAALAAARRLGDPAVLADALDRRLFLDSVLRDADPAVVAAHAGELLALAEVLDGRYRAQALSWSMLPLLDAGRLDDLDVVLDDVEEAGAAEGDARLRWWAALIRGVTAAIRGRLDEAEALGEVALDVGLAGEDRNVAAVHTGFLAGIDRQRGDLDRLLMSQRRTVEVMGAHPYVACRAVWIDALTGRRERASSTSAQGSSSLAWIWSRTRRVRCRRTHRAARHRNRSRAGRARAPGWVWVSCMAGIAPSEKPA